jgi:hypothetical protein
MSDSRTVTIHAADPDATAQTRPARLLKALAQNPQPLSTPALASLLAEPGRRAGRRWLDEHDKAPALAAEAQRKIEQALRTAAERDHALDEARAAFSRQTPRTSCKRAAQQLRDLGCTLDQIGAVLHVSQERICQDLLWDPAARTPPRTPKPRKHA